MPSPAPVAVRHSLPLLEARAAETRLCTYCPKLCRPACPVSTAEGRETVTPWGKMRAMGELTRDAVAAGDEPASAATAYACTGCGACTTLCLLDNPVADTLRDGRADAFAAGLSPAPARRVAEGFAGRLARLEEIAGALDDAEVPRGEGTTAFLPGCTMVRFDPGAVVDVARAVARLSPSGGCVLVADTCCGSPLLEAGDREGFLKHARRFAADLGGYDTVVTADAGCAHALRVMYERLNVSAPRWRKVEHVAELAVRNAHLLKRDPGAGEVVVHDSCKLGRGLGVYEEPRAVLTAITGRRPTELPGSRAQGVCSGGGSLLPATMPETAKGIAAELAGLVHEATGGREATVVTGCATSRRMLRGAGVAADDLAVWIARAVLG